MANFNVPPYYDDYDENKGYYKIMFRPSVAVQARELNQMQTMLQKQIERFGSHIFREGSIVVGGAFDLELDISYVKATSIQPAATSLDSLVGKTVVGATSGIKAYVRSAVYDSDNNVYVILLRYLSASNTSDVFLNDEVITSDDDPSLGFTVVPSTVANYTGTGSVFSIGQGVVFSKGFFLAFPTQTVVIDKYSSTPTKSIGLQVSESFVTELTDDSLNDNALGSSNENAPGAHRYQLEAVLSVVDYKTGYEDSNYIPLMDLLSGVVETNEERSQYARIYDELAKRTFDESGDYYVNGFGVRTREHLDTGVNEGLYLANAGGDSTKLSIDIEPGVAYVKGYEVNKLITQHVITDKSLTFNFVNNQLVNARTGGYFLIDEIVGSVDHDEGFIVNLYDTAENRISTNIKNTIAPTGKLIGTARLKALVYEAGTLGRSTAQMRAYLYDFNMNAGYIVSDVRGVGYTVAPNQFFADIVLNDANQAVFYDSNINVLLFPIGADHIRTVRSNTGSVDTSFQFIRTEDKTATFTNPAAITATVTTTNETLSYSEGFLSTAEKRELIVTMNGDRNVQLPGTVSNTTANVLTGTSTFFTRLTTGDRLLVNGTEYYIASIANNTSLQIANSFAGSISANIFYKALRSGDVIDLTANGSTGVQRTANVSSGILNIDLKEDTTYSPAAASVKLTYRVNRDTAGEVRKLLRGNRFVKIQTSNNAANSVGPYNLGVADVNKIRSIRMHTSAFTTGNEGSNVTSSFVLDNGQRDNHYDHAKIKHVGALDLTSKHLLVELDHFEPDYSSGFGYFSVDSYPINDNTASNSTIFTYEIPKFISSAGVEYNLRNVFDYRSVKSNTAVSAEVLSLATVNPGTTNTFIVDADGLRIAAPDSDISTDYSFYLARRDVVTLDKQGEFNVIQGEPGITPISPNVPDSVMGIANIYIPPYPSVSETLARLIGDRKIGCSSRKIANIRYTMREIGVLKNRIENLEYYNALTLLEKSAVDLKVTDENGLDRFKNGFFVDGFLDHSLGDSGNVDYQIAVDKIEQVIRPFFSMDSFRYKLETGGSSGYQVTGNLITRPYSQVTLLENKNVTTIRNIEQSVFRFIGTIELSPDGDTWCDTQTVDKVIQFGNEIPIENAMTTEWGSWETYALGYNVFDRNYGDRSGTIDPNKYLGTYTSYAAAVAASKSTPYYNSSGKKTSGTDDRSLIQTVTSEQRVGIVTKVTSETEIEQLGNFVTDVSLQPYIRPQVIRVFVKGLKANTKYYCYFDGENMSDYVVPGVIPDNGNIEQVVSFGVEGSEWRSNEFGEILGYLRLPANGKRFRTGTKEVIVTDSPTNAIDATSYAKTHFTATGLAVQKQNTVISTKRAIVQQEEIVETRQKQKVEVMGPSCMAYSFKVDVPRGQDGVFLTSVDVWVEAKHPSLGVWFEIREMNSAGGITRTQVPYSEVWLKSSQVTEWNGSLATEESGKTRVTFPSPVFLMNNTQYAFVIHTEGLNPDYYFWVSRLGETDILTNNPVTSRQLTGTLFTTNNNLNYDMVPDVDLKVRFNRANFTVGSGTIILGNQPTEFVNIANAVGNFTRNGEAVKTSENLNLSVTTAGANSVIVTDKISGVTSGVTGNVINISGANYYTDAVGFANGETYNVSNSSSGSKGITGVINLIESGSGVLRSYNTDSNFMILDNTNGKFFTNAVIIGQTSGNTARISSFDQFKYSTTTLKPYYLIFADTTCTFEKAGWLSNNSANSFDTYTGTSEWFPGTADSYSSFNNEVTILSRVNELTKFGTSSPNSSARVKALMATTSVYVSPVIDMSRAQSVYVHNIINNDATGETNPSGGNLLNRYISKPVTLADGQDAEDLLVKLTTYRPPNSDVKVWMKLRHNEDGVLFQDNPWIEMAYSNSFFSSEANKDDFVELDYTVPENYKNGNGVVQYIKGATSFAANSTVVSASANSILIANADVIFAANDEVFYGVPPGGTAVTPLVANTYYYINTVNSTAITLKSTPSGSTIDITDFRTDASPETHTIGGDVFNGFKQYSVKIGLMGTNSAKPPRVGDLRVIALQM